jgi:hypothetical protein
LADPCHQPFVFEIKSLFERSKDTREAGSTIYGEVGVPITYRSADLLWKPLGRLIRIVAVSHPTRGRILLMSTDLTLDPLRILELYSLRFKIEASFKQAVRTIGTYAYHFWMQDMDPIKRGSGDQDLHRCDRLYRDAVQRKMNAYHRHIQIGLIVQGLLQYLAVTKRKLVWRYFGSWL